MASEHVTGLVEDPVVATEVARVVVRDRAFVGDPRHEFARSHQMTQELRVVDHFVVPPSPGYSFFMVLKQCGQLATIFFAPASSRVARC